MKNKVTDLQAEILKTGSDYERAQEIHSQIKEIQKELSYMYKEWEERQK